MEWQEPKLGDAHGTPRYSRITFLIYIIKYQKYIYLIILSLSDLTFASGREGIDNPFIALVASSCLFV